MLANELGARKIRVNAVNPGMVETEGTHTAGFIGSDFEKGAVAQTPLGRTGQPDDIADVAVFLASDDFGLADRRAFRRQRRPALSEAPAQLLARVKTREGRHLRDRNARPDAGRPRRDETANIDLPARLM